ncbi:MAG: hypothetical protein Greene041662_14 [Candidatus Peregrinibacteria bacterium Greene0416_62]|nr:MAG: hypothetical protein Greene041662_14 [Candidatus Peregrinibacteria bacterium Greene0416_62]TSC99760.1 MAG: hypothetical protein Greene101449_537 [Candidatus Peregrinibacteria bacterium Greene1014_49]
MVNESLVLELEAIANGLIRSSENEGWDRLREDMAQRLKELLSEDQDTAAIGTALNQLTLQQRRLIQQNLPAPIRAEGVSSSLSA